MRKRKNIYRLFSLMLVISLSVHIIFNFAAEVRAETASGYFFYEELEDGTLQITHLTPSGVSSVQSAESIYIPGTLDKKQVTEIGDKAFSYYNLIPYLKTVVIGEGITSIRLSTFWKLSNLSSVTLPDTLVSMGDGCFAETALTTAVVPGGVKQLGNGVFDGCTHLRSATLKEGVEEIGQYVFYNNSALTTVEFPKNSLRKIGRRAFTNCTSLREMELPATVTEIGDEAFLGCTALGKLTLPAALVKIGENAIPEDNDLMLVIPEKLTDISQLKLEELSGVDIYVLENSEAADYLEQKKVAYHTYAAGTTPGKQPPMSTETPSPTETPMGTPLPSETPSGSVSPMPTETPFLASTPLPTPSLASTPLPTETPMQDGTSTGSPAPANTPEPAGTKTPTGSGVPTVDGGSNQTGTPKPTKTPAVTTAPKSVKDIPKGKICTVSGKRYRILDGKTAAFIGGTNRKVRSLTIPSDIKIKGKKYKVTVVADKACKGYAKLRKVIIGKNVKSIGAKVFANCRRLKQITIKSKKLKSVGKAAFRNVPADLTIKVPKKKISVYKKMIRKAI